MGIRGGALRFRDRRDAGRALGLRLVESGVLDRLPPRRVVLGLPRGGVPVAGEVARILEAPLDVFPAGKLGVPGHEELALGAVAGPGTRVLNQPVIEHFGISAEDVDAVSRSRTAELARRERILRGDRPPLSVAGATVIVVDDGLATGATMRAALQALRAAGPAAVVVAVPVGSPPTCRAIRAEADELVCVRMPDRFQAVGQAYTDFSPTTDEEVRTVLDEVNAVPGDRRPLISDKSPHRP